MTSMNQIMIVPANIHDLEDILEIEQESPPKSRYSADIFIHYMRYLTDGFALIKLKEEPVGYIIFERNGHLISIVVKKRYRRMGLGTMLIKYALQHTGGRLWLEVRISNKGAISFYKNMGMKITGMIPRYYGNEDALILSTSEDSENKTENI
jgi:ribosomal protein S18 acetylase RimI-like enzyme